MSWYEATAFESLSLCRSLIDNENLNAFDNILRQSGLEKLCRNARVASTIPTHSSEALAELEWLKTFLNNVNDRYTRLGMPIKKRKPQSISKRTTHDTQSKRTKANGNSVVPINGQPAPMSWRERMAERNVQRERAERADLQRKLSISQSNQRSARTSPTYNSHTPGRPQQRLKSRPKPIPKPIPKVETWCTCRGPSAGLMIACDNDKCPYEWFHAPCVGLSGVPSTKWYCPLCRPELARSSRSQRRRH